MPKQHTNAQARALISKLFDFWQAALNLDTLVIQFVEDRGPNPEKIIMTCEAALNGVDQGTAIVTVMSLALEGCTPQELSDTAAHELIHAVLWPLKYALFPMANEFFSVSQSRMIQALNDRANEQTTLNLERILTRHIRPPKSLLKF